MRIFDLQVYPESLQDMAYLKAELASRAGIPLAQIESIRLLRRSIDGRSRRVRYQIRVAIGTKEDPDEIIAPAMPSIPLLGKHRVLIIGAGPAGLFAALRCLELGMKPILLDRGEDLVERKAAVADLSARGILHTDSNYCFGIGGAGTFSDGKLLTRSSKRGDVEGILKIMVALGADPDIMVDAHPHIGSDQLPKLIKAFVDFLLSHGAEIHFNSRLCDLDCDRGHIQAAVLADGRRLEADAFILATGHSAEDIYELFAERHWALEAKPFALGVRLEHHQDTIDRMQYHQSPRAEILPPATYQVVAQAQGRGVYSFCMCPGGWIVPSMTHEGSLVVNGMSNAQRNGVFANAGLVVSVTPNDYEAFGQDALSGLRFRKHIETLAYQAGGGGFKAPSQLLSDFLNHRPSTQVLDTSYPRGLTPGDFRSLFPKPIASALCEGLALIGRKTPLFLSPEAQMIGVETRTSSPVRIVRDAHTGLHPDLDNLFPVGEGAGYAGGIVSSAMDGYGAAGICASMLDG